VGESLRNGRYELRRLLGEGAQGSTVEAEDKESGRLVAIKRFTVRHAKVWKDVELAEREANVLASLDHPMLPAYVEHFEEDGVLHLVMERVEGVSLAEYVERGGRFGEGDVRRLLEDAAVALAYLHSRAPPIIHRDLKPRNVIRRPNGSFAFVDFGAVRDRLKPEGGSTIVGTFGYMAPEQFQGRAVPASDVYAIGATALWMLTGQEPEDLPHKGLGIDVPAALGPRRTPELVTILTAMVEPDPEERVRSIAPLVGGFELRGRPVGLPSEPPEPIMKNGLPRPPPRRQEYALPPEEAQLATFRVLRFVLPFLWIFAGLSWMLFGTQTAIGFTIGAAILTTVAKVYGPKEMKLANPLRRYVKGTAVRVPEQQVRIVDDAGAEEADERPDEQRRVRR
jgi:serine/threonine protein kinase